MRTVSAAVLLIALLLTGCASKAMKPGDGEYIGTARGRYAAVHFMAEDSNLLISLENTTAAAMQSLLISVMQETSGGVQESQYPFRMLRMRANVVLTIPIHPKATGNITVTYYFQPALIQLPGQPSELQTPEFLEDTVRFKVIL